MPFEHTAFLTIVLLLVGTLISVQIRKQASRQARIALIDYLGIMREFNDRHMTIQHQMGLVEYELVKRIHLIARRGMQIVDTLLAYGAITYAKREEAYQFFRNYGHVDQRTRAPQQLPTLDIETCGDTQAMKAEAEWQVLIGDTHTLYQYATTTYESAFREFFTTPGDVWNR